MALVQFDNQVYIGTNSGALWDRNENLDYGRLMRETQNEMGNQGSGSPAWHAEGLALFRAFFRNPAIPRRVVIYTDREPCAPCQRELPIFARRLGIDNLVIVDVNTGRVYE